jgi:hypothetical protein
VEQQTSTPVTATTTPASLDDSNNESNNDSNSSSKSDDDSLLSPPPQQQEPLPQLKNQLPAETETAESSALLPNNENKSIQIISNKSSIVNKDHVFLQRNINQEDDDDESVQELKQRIRDFLSEPIVEVVDFGLVLLSSLLVAISTIPATAAVAGVPIQWAENTIGSVFCLEFFARWYSVADYPNNNSSDPAAAAAANNNNNNNNKRGGLGYLTQPSVWVDIVAVILPLLFATQPSSFWAESTWIPNWLTSSSGLINLRLLRILRLQRVLQDMDTFTKFEMALGISDSNVKAWQLQLARTVLSIFTLLSVSTGLSKYCSVLYRGG